MSVRPERTPRSLVLERLAYGLAAPLLAYVPNHYFDSAPNQVLLAVGGGAFVWAVVKLKGRELGSGGFLMRALPFVEAAVIDLFAKSTSDWKTDAALAATWAGTNMALKPFYATSKTQKLQQLQLEAAPQDVAQQFDETAAEREKERQAPVREDFAPGFQGGLEYLWAVAGTPGDTEIVRLYRHPGRENDFTMLLHAREAGRPILNLTEAHAAAAFGVDSGAVKFFDVKPQEGRQGGPGWKEVRVTPDAYSAPRSSLSDAEWWDMRVGHGEGPIANTKLVRKERDGERGVTYWLARMKDGAFPEWDTRGVCRALGIAPEAARVHIEEDGEKVLVQVWDVSPLARTYIATRALLIPDRHGWYTIGYLENGQPALNRVFTDRGAAHGMFIAPSGGGKSELIVCTAAAVANWGGVIMVAAHSPDEKIASLAPHAAAQGIGALYMVRLLRMLDELMDIRGAMPWADGNFYDWSPDAEGCPYLPLAGFLDEYLTAAKDGLYGPEIAALFQNITVKGRKYGISIYVGAQSAQVQHGFTQVAADNIRENSIPILLRTPPNKITEEFKALGFPAEKIPEPLPRTFMGRNSTGRLDRILTGTAEPPAPQNTGGVGWQIQGNDAPRMRTLLAVTRDEPIARLFPDVVNQPTEHEIRELTARGVWFDWTLPPQPGEFGDDEDTDTEAASTTNGDKKKGRPLATATVGGSALAEAQNALKQALSK